MGIFRNGTYWWLLLPRPGMKALRESSKIPVQGASAHQTKAFKRLAEEAYATRMAELARARYEFPADDGYRPTFAEHARWFRTHVLPRHKGQTREAEILTRLEAHFGKHPLSAVTADAVREWQTARLEDVSAGTVNRETDVLKSVLQSAVPRAFPVSPLAKMKRLRTPDYVPTLLTRAQERQLLQELREPYRTILLIGLDGLVRLGSILDLEWRRVAKDHLTIVNPKNGTMYRVPTTRRVTRALAAQPRTNAWVFPTLQPLEGRDRNRNVRKALERACARCEPPIPWTKAASGLTFHGATRHTGASRAINDGGANLRTVQELGSWKDIRMLERYLHPTERLKVEAVRAIAGERTRHTTRKKKC